MDPQQLAKHLGKSISAGTVLFREGDVGGEMFVIQGGSVRISRRVGDAERTLAVLGPGEFVGEMAILTGERRSATATVVEDARVLILDGAMLEEMISRNTEIAVRLLKKVAFRLRAANDLIEILLHRDPRVRVVKGLARLVAERGEPRGDGFFVEMTAEELAGQVGLDGKQVAEVLGRLELGGMVVGVPDSGYLVRDMPRLREFAEFLEMRERFGDLEG
ncbi:MAG: Crp/Fnr family transcriptional regulator [Myxococcota bacterium]|nr:Crp/Fnr family transcriptional regulator [Myxococcota bacterium]